MTIDETVDCPLCGSPVAITVSAAVPSDFRLSAFGRHYWLCKFCDLLFMDTACRLDSAAELRRYALHQNKPDDAGYLRFLDRLRRPVLAELQRRGFVPAGTRTQADGSARPLRGLDYGSGPQPVLSLLFRQDGWQLDCWDPNFAPDPPPGRLDGGGYNFILCCEVAEHFRQPLQDFRRMLDLLAPGGFLALMTGIRPAASCSALEGWPYLSDATHVSLYSRRSFQWLARQLGLTASFPAENVCFLEKA